MPNTRLAGKKIPSRPSKMGTLLTTAPIKKANPRVPMAMNAPESRKNTKPSKHPMNAAMRPPARIPKTRSAPAYTVINAEV